MASTANQNEENKRAETSGRTRSTDRTKPRGRGAPTGNQNARKGGLFAKYFTDDELGAVATAVADPKVDDIIPLLLVRLRRALDEGASLDSIARGTDSYIRALKARYLMSGDAARNFETAFARAIDEIMAEMGLPL